MLNSHVVYGIYCNVCDSSYVGKTKKHLEIRFKEHMNVRLPTAVTEHIMASNYQFCFEDLKLLSLKKLKTASCAGTGSPIMIA